MRDLLNVTRFLLTLRCTVNPRLLTIVLRQLCRRIVTAGLLLSFGVSAVREEPFCGLLNAASWLDTKRRQNTVDMNVTGAHEYRVWHNLPRGQRCAEHHISPHVGKPGVASTGLCRNNLLRGPQRPEPLFFAESWLLSSRAPNQRGRD